MKSIILFLIVFQFQFVFSQENKLDLKINNKIELLKQNGSEAIVVYSENCNGCAPKIIRKDECFSEETKFIFWSQNGKYFMQKMDDCYEYVEQNIDDSKFMKIAVNNAKLIEKAKIKTVEYKKGEKIITMHVNHYKYFDFDFYFGNKQFSKSIIRYEL